MKTIKLHPLDFDSLVNNIEKANYGIAKIEWELRADNFRIAKLVYAAGATFVPSTAAPMRGGYTIEDAIEDAIKEHAFEIKVGDVVQLKSGGPAMTVDAFYYDDGSRVGLTWFDGCTLVQKMVLTSIVKPWTAKDDPTVPMFYDPETVQVVK
jgi:uncharacterized protein YodC (DUF2158 family)